MIEGFLKTLLEFSAIQSICWIIHFFPPVVFPPFVPPPAGIPPLPPPFPPAQPFDILITLLNVICYLHYVDDSIFIPESQGLFLGHVL
jgi:hypothetical protein